ncbi:MAG: TetR/AcrR family transcriptional regulator [Ruegeria sp.]|uniref:TetR/AcrR family transcriptional regulator n=1 Tax=Ruegeria sp. TaxID=1879320 RepID=UPI00349EE04E
MEKVDTKTALMDAAEQEVRQKGADGFSYKDLSEKIGIRKASIHYHFPNKTDLLTAIMARYAEKTLNAVEEFSASHDLAGPQLIEFVTLYRNALQDCSALCLCVAYTVSQDALDTKTTSEIDRFRTRLLGWLTQVFDAGKRDGSINDVGDPSFEAAAALALVEGAQITARIGGQISLYDAATKIFRDRLN